MNPPVQIELFNEQIINDPIEAASYTTAAFLSTLLKFSSQANETQLTNIIRALALILPSTFMTLCKNENEIEVRDCTRLLIDNLESSWIAHTSPSVRLYAFKCLQTLIVLETKKEKEEDAEESFSLNMIRPNHRLLSSTLLEESGKKHLDMLLDHLAGEEKCISVVTAIISLLPCLARKRTQHTRAILGTLVSLGKKVPERFETWESETVEKSIKLAIASMLRFDRLASYRSELLGAYSVLGGNPSVLQLRLRNGNDDSRRKRQHAESSERKDKRLKSVLLPIVDISNIPVNMVVDLTAAILRTVSSESFSEHIKWIPPSTLALEPALLDKTETEPPVSSSLVDLGSVTGDLVPSTRLANDSEESWDHQMQEGYALVPSSLSKDEELLLLKHSLERVLHSIQITQHQLSTSQLALAALAPQSTSPGHVNTPLMVAMISKLFVKAIASCTKLHDLAHAMESEQVSDSVKDEDAKLSTVDPEKVSKGQIPSMAWLREVEYRVDEVKEIFLTFVCQDLSTRYEFALAWLHEERYYDLRISHGEKRGHDYFYWIFRLLERGFETVDHKDKSIVKLLLGAPLLSDSLIEQICKIMREHANRFVMCISVLRDLASQRPTVRSMCVKALLDLCMDSEVKVRSTAIAAVKRWVPDHVLAEQVRLYSVEAVTALTEQPPNHEKEQNEEAISPCNDQWNDQTVTEHLDLFLAICSRDATMLSVLFDLYTHMDKSVQQLVRQNIDRTILSIGIESHELVQCIKQYPEGSETLILRILKILSSAANTLELQSLVREVYTERKLRAKFMLPILKITK
ncbi:hypothetical protein DM01DRAFT_1338513 [Hesseltinella vesiculosa]|uniref:Symplekin/Pta1 N-terminal domain-containing protein n=1 Tax=Hesseltinella vesiculosa TaxID=101127 RepID=A0A1X2GA71_9FUNG|nr:hypothetical protein DM01DRAFT_1338513 [Hesseltinella vesiculosa]